MVSADLYLRRRLLEPMKGVTIEFDT